MLEPNYYDLDGTTSQLPTFYITTHKNLNANPKPNIGSSEVVPIMMTFPSFHSGRVRMIVKWLDEYLIIIINNDKNI